MTMRLSKDQPLTIAIHAIGGQGGGVVSNWIVALAESQGWVAQSTSVPGVAQRTGATIYYIEIAKAAKLPAVMGMMPMPGAVDLLVAAEWMEVGRAIQRGFVSPDRTTLIASTHRSLSVKEKSVPGNGISDPAVIDLAGGAMAARFIKADFAAIAADNGSVISAALFGGIAGAGALPFPRAAFEAAIKSSGVGVKSSLKAFAAAFDAVSRDATQPTTEQPQTGPDLQGGSKPEQARYDRLLTRLKDSFAPGVQTIARLGLNRVIDFQDAAYGQDYLDQLDRIQTLDSDKAEWKLTAEMAKYLATAMAYQDVIRVADLKARASRSQRLRQDAGTAPAQPLSVTEFMHPRVEEMRGLLPRFLGSFAHGRLITWVLGRFAGGKRIRSDSVTGFLQLYFLAGLRGWRRRSIRHEVEMRHLQDWFETVMGTAPQDYALAVEITRARRLIKGYSDTHARGLGKYDRVLAGIKVVQGRDDAAIWAARLIATALQDADGVALDGALKTIDSFASEAA